MHFKFINVLLVIFYSTLVLSTSVKKSDDLNEFSSLNLDDLSELDLSDLIEKNLNFINDIQTDSFSGIFWDDEPDLRLTTVEMIELRGFKAESHYTVTEDCYILNIHRIVNPLIKKEDLKRPLLIQHGLLGTSADFILNSVGGYIDDDDNRNLGFFLSKLGYDVWLGNMRGNRYNYNHTTFKIRDKKFWEFTHDDHALYDLPAMLAYIQNQTDCDDVAYIGYSQGTITMFELLSLRPDFSKIVSTFIALAPITKVTNTKTPFKRLIYFDILKKYLLRFPESFLSTSTFNSYIGDWICRGITVNLCKNIMFMFAGYDSKQLNTTRLPVYVNHLPAGTSTWNILKFVQSILTDKFQMFDFENSKRNRQCYNSDKPTEILIENINLENIYLIYGKNDWLADMDDIEELKQSLKVPYKEHEIPYDNWNHLDFMIAQQSYKYVNREVALALSYQDSFCSRKDASVRLPIYQSNTCNAKKCWH